MEHGEGKKMKRWFLGLTLALALVFAAGCGGEDEEATGRAEVDLTTLNSNMMYSEVYNMVCEPEEYEGKVIKMKGLYRGAYDESSGRVYAACLIMDATACCAQGVNFELTEGYDYPADYPQEDQEIVVTGTYELREEYGAEYPVLVDASWEVAAAE